MLMWTESGVHDGGNMGKWGMNEGELGDRAEDVQIGRGADFMADWTRRKVPD
jgi:hypothetical protein